AYLEQESFRIDPLLQSGDFVGRESRAGMRQLDENRLEVREKGGDTRLAPPRGRLPVNAIRSDEIPGAPAFRGNVERMFGVGVGELEQHPFGAVEVIADDDEEEAVF